MLLWRENLEQLREELRKEEEDPGSAKGVLWLVWFCTRSQARAAVEQQLNGSFLAMHGVSGKRLNKILKCVRGETVSRCWERILPLCGAGETDSGILHPVQVSTFKRGCWRVLKRATKMIERLEKQLYKGENLKTSICFHY